MIFTIDGFRRLAALALIAVLWAVSPPCFPALANVTSVNGTPANGTSANGNLVLDLLRLPAPPRPERIVDNYKLRKRPPEFFNPMKPPADNAPIDELLDYWVYQNSKYRDLGFNPRPSPDTFRRLIEAANDNPLLSLRLLNVMQGNPDFAEIVKRCYQSDCIKADDSPVESDRFLIEKWLRYNSDLFIEDLQRAANSVRTQGEYVTNQAELLALVRLDWRRAEPIVNRLYANKGERVPYVLATWALYRHALETDSLADKLRYREKLQSIVEDKDATDAMRDLALDALVKEKEWDGRDAWYLSLLDDDTLFDLKVNGQTFTGLTTIIYYSEPERFVDKMIELMRSDNRTVKRAAVANLLVRLQQLDDADWAKEVRVKITRALLPELGGNREGTSVNPDIGIKILRQLEILEIPESVPYVTEFLSFLLKQQNNDQTPITNRRMTANSNTNSAAAAATRAADIAQLAINADPKSPAQVQAAVSAIEEGRFREAIRTAVGALANQKDPSAVRVLWQAFAYERDAWQKRLIINAIVRCGGISPTEMADAVVRTLRLGREGAQIGDNAQASPQNQLRRCALENMDRYISRPELAHKESDHASYPSEESRAEYDNYTGIMNSTAEEDDPGDRDEQNGCWDILNVSGDLPAIESDRRAVQLTDIILELAEKPKSLTEELLRRINSYKNSEPELATSLRSFVLKIDADAADWLNLEDILSPNFDAVDVVEVLARRREIVSRYPELLQQVIARGGIRAAIGLCIREDTSEIGKLIETGDNATTAMAFACVRLIRLPISLSIAQRQMDNQDKITSKAAELYLISEDSQEARRFLWSKKPNERLILGSRKWFAGTAEDLVPAGVLTQLFETIIPGFSAISWSADSDQWRSIKQNERYLREKLEKDGELVVAYGFRNYTILVYPDRYIFQEWTDSAKYLERPLFHSEFVEIKAHLVRYPIDHFPALIKCAEDCRTSEMIMVGRTGGQRIFGIYDVVPPEFFAGLEKIFEHLAAKKGTLRYTAAENLSGLEIVYSDARFPAKTVAVRNGTIVAVLDNLSERKRFTNELSRAIADSELQQSTDSNDSRVGDENGNSDLSVDARQKQIEQLRFRAENGSLGWYSIFADRPPQQVSQPQDFYFIRERPDDADKSRWMLKSNGIELAADGKALYKVQAGRRTIISRGDYEIILLSSDGRWAFAYDRGNDWRMIKIDLLTGRLKRLEELEQLGYYPAYSVPGTNLVALARSVDDLNDSTFEWRLWESVDSGKDYRLFDPNSGKILPTVGELRPLFHQTFRPLQPTGMPNEFWAAIPRLGAGTIVGKYRSDRFTFTPVAKIPGLIFASMDMWVHGNKIYFVYKGDILSVPIANHEPRSNK